MVCHFCTQSAWTATINVGQYTNDIGTILGHDHIYNVNGVANNMEYSDKSSMHVSRAEKYWPMLYDIILIKHYAAMLNDTLRCMCNESLYGFVLNFVHFVQQIPINQLWDWQYTMYN